MVYLWHVIRHNDSINCVLELRILIKVTLWIDTKQNGKIQHARTHTHPPIIQFTFQNNYYKFVRLECVFSIYDITVELITFWPLFISMQKYGKMLGSYAVKVFKQRLDKEGQLLTKYLPSFSCSSYILQNANCLRNSVYPITNQPFIYRLRK